MNPIGPQPNQFIANAQQVGLGAFVNQKGVNQAEKDAEGVRKALHHESSQLSQAARIVMEQTAAPDTEQMLDNAKQAGAQADEMDQMTQDPNEQSHSRRQVQQWVESRETARTQGWIAGTTRANEEQLLKAAREQDLVDSKDLEEQERSPEEILEGVPGFARAAAAKMVENQPLDKLADLKPIP
ncbi:MAG: hypothetical protein AB1758_10325, partial [Candidatus Eremiobacterota bacterium]